MNSASPVASVRRSGARTSDASTTSIWKAIVALGAVTVGYRFIAYLVLKFMREKWYNIISKMRWKASF